jgi:Mrp family chromosome partitioning ATPase/capsular polysaccharide biosynthesis protein
VKDAFANRPTTLADYVTILRRRKWIIVALPVIAAVSAYAVSNTQSALYQSTAQVLVNRSSIVSAISGVTDPALGDPHRFLTTEASIARSPVLASRVASAAGVSGLSAGAVLGASTITPRSDADLLDISVSWDDGTDAARIANAYASEFTRYKTELDTQRIDDALHTLRTRVRALQAQGQTGSSSYSILVQEQSQLETIGTLLANNTSVLQPAVGAGKIRPRPKRTALIGGLLGGVFGLALAFLAEALDRRVRSESEIEDTLGLPLIGRVPAPPRHLRDTNGLVMLAEPAGPYAESFRKLKTSIEFLNLDRGARTIMVTSALPREGKSTTIANLAVAFARAGRSVSLVDLDLRRPFLHSFFYRGSARGISDVLIGGDKLSGALRPVVLPPASSPGPASTNGSHPHARIALDVQGDSRPIVNLLPAGTALAAGADAVARLLENERLDAVLAELAEQSDLVLVDAPPLLAVDDAMRLTAKVDALVVVLHAGIPRPLLKELARQLEASRAPALGFILTGVSEADGYGYGYGYGYGPYSYDVPTKAERGAERV